MKSPIENFFSKKVNILIGIAAAVIVGVLCFRGFGELRIYVGWSERVNEYLTVFHRVHQAVMEILALFRHR